jgi:YVTN family beta-propeller protein
MHRPVAGFIALLVGSCLSPDALSQRVIATIPVGNQPIYLAADQKTNRIYVSNQEDDTVSVIDGTSNTVTATVKVGLSPNGIALNSETNRIYVANLNGGTLSIINGDALTTSTLRLGINPAKVAVNPSTNRVYVTLENEHGSLAVIDGKRQKVETFVPLPPYPLGVAVDALSNQIYVADFLCGCGRISVISGLTNKVIETITLSGASLVSGIALDSKKRLGYASDENIGVFVINLTNNEVLGEVGDLDYPNEVTAASSKGFAVEPDTGSNRAIFIDALSLTVRRRLRVGKFPTGVAVNSTTKRVYVANRLSNTVSVIQMPLGW